MVFPVETEERVKRKALDVSRDHLREVVDISRKISQLVSAFVDGDEASAKTFFSSFIFLRIFCALSVSFQNADS